MGSSRAAHNFTTGETPSSTAFDGLPGGLIGENSGGSNITNITVETTVIQQDVPVGNGRAVKIEALFDVASSNGGTDVAIARIYRDSVPLRAFFYPLPVLNARATVDPRWLDRGPVAGTHTYRVTIDLSGVGPLTVNASQPIDYEIYDVTAWPLA